MADRKKPLTPELRTKVIDMLTADLVEGADRMSLFLWDILQNGWRGFVNYTDEELVQAFTDAFDYDPLGEDDD